MALIHFRLPEAANDPCIGGVVDTTMLYAPASGGVKRYLSAKRRWFAENRPWMSHSLVLPGSKNHESPTLSLVQSAALPFSKGYRWPTNARRWAERLASKRPGLIEAQDPYLPGAAALRAGQALGVPAVYFCHSDLGRLGPFSAAKWSRSAARRHWARRAEAFDAVLAPSNYMVGVLAEAGLSGAKAIPLGVDLDVFSPRPRDEAIRERLGVAPHERLLVFAGRPAREKRIEVLTGAVERLGHPYKLLLIGAGPAASSDRVICLPFESDEGKLAELLSACDALVHANPYETLGLVVLEAMACGLPVVGVGHGGVGEIIEASFGQKATRATPAALAEAVSALFERDQQPLRLAARRRAEESYGWDAVFNRLTEVYFDLTADAGFLQAS